MLTAKAFRYMLALKFETDPRNCWPKSQLIREINDFYTRILENELENELDKQELLSERSRD